jgi:hypothetical protein
MNQPPGYDQGTASPVAFTDGRGPRYTTFCHRSALALPVPYDSLVSGDVGQGACPEKEDQEARDPNRALLVFQINQEHVWALEPWSSQPVDSILFWAEEEGFEPTVPLRVRRFSKPVPSTARPLLRGVSGS